MSKPFHWSWSASRLKLTTAGGGTRSVASIAAARSDEHDHRGDESAHHQRRVFARAPSGAAAAAPAAWARLQASAAWTYGRRTATAHDAGVCHVRAGASAPAAAGGSRRAARAGHDPTTPRRCAANRTTNRTQYYLLQAVASDLVNYLNAQKRQTATMADLDMAVAKVLVMMTSAPARM